MTPEEKMSHLALTFPSLNAKSDTWNGILPWDALQLLRNHGVASSGERHVIRFLLDVWNRDHELIEHFRVVDAMAVWDNAHRRAFVAWASNPFWC